MAATGHYIANPTDAATTGTIVVQPHSVALSTDLTAADIIAALDQGCTIAPAGVSTTTRNNPQLVEMGAHLLEGLVRAVVSAGTDTWGVKGL